MSYGKCIAAGLAAKGYFNILGTDEINSEIAVGNVRKYQSYINAVKAIVVSIAADEI